MMDRYISFYDRKKEDPIDQDIRDDHTSIEQYFLRDKGDPELPYYLNGEEKQYLYEKLVGLGEDIDIIDRLAVHCPPDY